MPVEFLTDEQAAGYAAFRGAPARAESERFFFLDDADRELAESKRRAHNRLGFAVQLTTVPYLGVFLDHPTDVPVELADYLAEHPDIGDASVLKAYGEPTNTRLDHARELRQLLEYQEFGEAEPEQRAWVDARAPCRPRPAGWNKVEPAFTLHTTAPPRVLARRIAESGQPGQPGQLPRGRYGYQTVREPRSPSGLQHQAGPTRRGSRREARSWIPRVVRVTVCVHALPNATRPMWCLAGRNGLPRQARHAQARDIRR
ncbi:DUF4158 domain-containing protein [Streptomyces sp. XD-27]|nr:DUF4158 domain-containing protein [Streptomyces sp. XD-27]WKX74027.1 DUF4158 domain-containing protein [Streptomyces sp. XD-27]